jgi:type IV pilus assembly protein PilF
LPAGRLNACDDTQENAQENAMTRSFIALALLLTALLSACVVAPSKPANGDSKDRITASDESDGSKRARVRLELATEYFSRGQMATALDQVKLAIAADPSLGEAFNLRGLIYAGLGDDRLAEESFRRALQLNPRDADTMQNFGWYLCQHKRYGEANLMFSQALTVPQYRDPARTLLTQGVCQSFAGQPQEAERSLLRSYEIDPSSPATAVNLAELLYRRGDFERARFYIRRVNGVPEVANAQTLWLAAKIETKMGNGPEAQLLGKQLRARFPDSRESSAFDRGLFDE